MRSYDFGNPVSNFRSNCIGLVSSITIIYSPSLFDFSELKEIQMDGSIWKRGERELNLLYLGFIDFNCLHLVICRENPQHFVINLPNGC